MTNDFSQEPKASRLLPLLIALVFHGLLLLFLFLFMIHSPIPPFPPDSGGAPGIEVSLGTMSEGMGDNPADISAAAKTQTARTAPSNPDDNNVVTSAVEETAVLEPHKVKKVTKKKSDKVTEQVKPAAPQPSNDLLKALDSYDKSSKNVSGGHGTGARPGNEGDPNGKPGAKGMGIPGDGGANGPGKGGPGGSGAHLANRHLVVPATLVSNEQEEGIVVVAITVDKDGNVTEAEPRAKGSTTTSSVLWAKARQAALKARFDRSPDGSSEQHGVYIFNFSFK